VSLTAQQLRFVEEYLKDLNGKQAAIRAGYSPKSAEACASRLLSKAKVKAEIEKLQAARSKRTEIDTDWVLKRLAAEAEADIADLYDSDTGALLPVHEWPEIWRKGLVAGVDVVEEFETVDGKKERVGTVRKLRLSDRIKRIELIGKHVSIQAFREQVHGTGTITLNVSPEDAEL